MQYNKPAFSLDDQLRQLENRGLIIKDPVKAKHYLNNISYYRLSGYWWPLQSDKINHVFKPDSYFETVIKIYSFDQELRVLLFDAIEKIEVSFRAKLSHQLSLELSPWWFEDPTNFIDPKEHSETIKVIDRELKRCKDVFIVEHKNKYSTDHRRPPSWKTLEVLPLGTLSKLYGNLKTTIKAKNRIASELGTVNMDYLPSWLQDITQIRNICAHHGRLWNKNLPGRPKILSKPPYDWVINVPPTKDHAYLYIHICCIKYLLNVVVPGNSFTYKLHFIFKKYPNIDLNALGMPRDWMHEPLWDHKINIPYNTMKFYFDMVMYRITNSFKKQR